MPNFHSSCVGIICTILADRATDHATVRPSAIIRPRVLCGSVSISAPIHDPPQTEECKKSHTYESGGRGQGLGADDSAPSLLALALVGNWGASGGIRGAREEDGLKVRKDFSVLTSGK